MNNPVAFTQIPNPPPVGATQQYAGLAGSVVKMGKWAFEVTRWLTQSFQTIQTQLNTQVQGVGTAIVSAGTITVSSPIHHVTGAATISTINAPAGFSGPLWLVADGAFAITTGGNIALARGPFTVGQVETLVYDPATALWYPQ